MKRINLSDKTLKIQKIQEYFKVNPPIGEMGERYQFVELFAESEELYRFSKESVDKKYHRKITQNLIINLSSAIEIHIKELIRINGKNWNKENYAELLSEKITLENAYKLFKEVNVTRELIIAKNSSLTSFDNIIKTLTKLTIPTFMQELDNVKLSAEGKATLKLLFPEWKSSISLLLDERNKIVHEGSGSIEFCEDDIQRIKRTAFFFMWAIDRFCVSRNFDTEKTTANNL